MILLNHLPFYLFSFLFSNVLYISFISIFSWIDFSKFFYLIQTLLFFISVIFLRRWKKLFEIEKQPYFYLLIPYLLIIFLRLPIYTKVHDDLTYYLVAGEYTKNIWTNSHIFPTYAIYLYNSLHLFYNYFINIVGLRITLFISMFILSIWMVSLNLRIKKLLKTEFQKKILDFFFISFPFWPHLMAIHGTFMADFFSLVFLTEAFYQFINKNKDKTFAFIALIIGGLVKQSSVFYVLPVFAYWILKNLRKVDYKVFLPLIVLFSSYFIRLYFEIGNPLMGWLFNNIFKSPVAANGVGLEFHLPFGGENTWQKLIWPLTAQFSPRFAEGFVSRYAKYYFFIFLAFIYLYFFVRVILKRKIVDLLVFFSFVFWIFHTGYARWVIPLISISWILMISDLSFIKIKLAKKSLLPIYLNVIILSLSSIKTDFGWRPYHNPPFFKQNYFAGWKQVGKDRFSDIKKEFAGEFDNIEVVSPIRSEKAYFYAFMGSLYGKKVIQSVNDLNYYLNLLHSDKISPSFKKRLQSILEAKKVLLVLDTIVTPEAVIKESMFYQNYNCQKIGYFKEISQIQNASFSTIVKYRCVKN